MSDTRQGALASISAATLREMALNVLKQHPAGLTSDEIAQAMRETVLAVRPRITELKKAGRIRDTGFRRRNRSGRRAAVVALS